MRTTRHVCYGDTDREVIQINTKKAIFQWWESLGNREVVNDLPEFRRLLEPPCTIVAEGMSSKYKGFALVISSPRWKHLLRLYFSPSTGECYRIVGY